LKTLEDGAMGRGIVSRNAGAFLLYDGSGAVVSPIARVALGAEDAGFVASVEAAVRECVPLAGAHLASKTLWGLSAEGGDFRGADFRWSDLTFADLTGADLRGADFGFADLTAANLEGARLEGASFEGACLEGARFDPAPASRLKRAAV